MVFSSLTFLYFFLPLAVIPYFLIPSRRWRNGRFVMTCCENDIQFVGIVAKGSGMKAYKNRDWVEVTATVKKENFEAYQGDGPVLYIEKITTTSKPEQEVVTF